MIDITDLILAADNYETEDTKLRSLSQKQARDLVINLVPKELEFTFNKILKSESPVNTVLSMLPQNMQMVELTIDFPYISIGDDKVNINIHYVDDKAYEEPTDDSLTISFTYEEFKKAL